MNDWVKIHFLGNTDLPGTEMHICTEKARRNLKQIKKKTKKNTQKNPYKPPKTKKPLM